MSAEVVNRVMIAGVCRPGCAGDVNFELATLTGLSFFVPVARSFGYAALLAWLLTLAGLARTLVRELTTSATNPC